MKFEYYYNNVPGIGKTRNNLVYTSLVNTDMTVFVQWYHNDTEYHNGQNEVVDSNLMQSKFDRELKYLQLMSKSYPNCVPRILDVDEVNRKIYLLIDGLDFWNRSNCEIKYYDETLPTWREQMLNIVDIHKELGLHKYSMHPSSYFIVNKQLKSINYFFAYHKSEPEICINDVVSHIYSDRLEKLKEYTDKHNIPWDSPVSYDILDKLCYNSFRNNYPEDFINNILERSGDSNLRP